ncbi:transmembrane protein 246 [Exaiptasia diaphana]|uniref:Uncharacterized protein n=1 Tax=Exaiptasia diaphana TaxID=2652724 RepID=A0A913XA14_EXADI|nr:transmembrane protein 246 [Exaiptasia diaphana]KXJ13702.1 Transmembrane protein 246 [Exaiptasia diaphana]
MVRCKLWIAGKSARHIIMLYGLTFLLILPLICSNLQFSIYNFTSMDSKAGRDQMLKENQMRILEIQKKKHFIENTDILERMRNWTSPDLAITIITTARNQGADNYNPLYLTQVVWKMLWLIYEGQRNNIVDLKVSFSVCNVDGYPEVHKEAMDLTYFLYVNNKYQDKHDKSFKTWNIFEKEKQDYVYCLNSSLEQNPKFILVVEDDSYPEDDLFIVLKTLISSGTPVHKKHYGLSSKHGKQFKIGDSIYVKLFHPERLIGYISLEPDRLSELFGISSLFGTVLLVVYRYTINKRIASESLYHRNVLWLSLFIYVALVVMAVGRPHLLKFRRLLSPHLYSFMSAPECCTPAMLFPHHGAQEVVEHLSSQSCYPSNGKDTVLDKYIKAKNKKAFIVQPNLFKHIGFFSSLRQKFLNPYVV